MKEKFNKIADWTVRRYLQVQQVSALLGLINFFLIFRLSFGMERIEYLIIVAIIIFVVGWFMDVHLKFRKRVSGYQVDHNPPWVEQYKRIKRMEKDIISIKKILKEKNET